MSSNPAENDPSKYASKTRVERIPLTYYRRADPLDRTKLILTVLAVAGFGAWAAYGLIADPQQHSPGQVASVHAMWNTQCAACHKAYEPTSADSFALFGGAVRHGSIQCTQCHAGGPHHANLKTAEASCASCHHEHRGLDARLTLVADANCTSCHRALDGHAVDVAKIEHAQPFAAGAIHSFVVGHPEFKSLAGPDPGHLKFSHARHMALGQKLLPNDREAAKKLSDLAPHDRAAYDSPANGLDGAIQLQCASCHQTGSGNGAVPTNGDYMQPVNFAQHCAACHPQTYAPVARANAPLATMPHGLPPEQMKRLVKAEIVERFVAEEAKPPAASAEAEPLGFPGKSKKSDTAETAAFIAEQLPRAEQMLRDRCLQCHSFPEGTAPSPLKSALVRTEVPAVWLKNAKFDHRAHRSMSCTACHAEAAAVWKPGTPTLDHERVMIAGYESCVKCHAPQVAGGTAGARFDCIACHRYHGADQPPGSFAQAFQPSLDTSGEWNLERLLKSK